MVGFDRINVSLRQFGHWFASRGVGPEARNGDQLGPSGCELEVHSGLRRLTAGRCDELVQLPMALLVQSLNVSHAAAIALYELARGPAGD